MTMTRLVGEIHNRIAKEMTQIMSQRWIHRKGLLIEKWGKWMSQFWGPMVIT